MRGDLGAWVEQPLRGNLTCWPDPIGECPLFAHTGRLESEPDVTLAALNVQSSACYEAPSQIIGGVSGRVMHKQGGLGVDCRCIHIFSGAADLRTVRAGRRGRCHTN